MFLFIYLIRRKLSIKCCFPKCGSSKRQPREMFGPFNRTTENARRRVCLISNYYYCYYIYYNHLKLFALVKLACSLTLKKYQNIINHIQYYYKMKINIPQHISKDLYQGLFTVYTIIQIFNQTVETKQYRWRV